MDTGIAKMREKALEEFIQDNNINNMLFLDLDLYLKGNSLIDIINNEIRKSYFDKKVVLTESQIEILNILENNNLFLSAPTSFGKTFIVLEYMIRHPNLKNIVFIVPTLALMNELLKKIYNNFGDNYNICINENEKFADKNIFIFVPERSDISFVNRIKDLGIDLLIIDEIYKLKPNNKKELNNDDRIIIMNKVYLNLLQISKKIILLGPFIKKITFEQTKLDIVRYYTNFSPVCNYVYKYEKYNWIDYMGSEKELVYFSSPSSIYKSLELIINKFSENTLYVDRYKNEIKHLENIFFKDWYGIKLLKRGIGVHHGKIPAFLRKFYEDEFKRGMLKSLLCTCTLMEGINTPTMKMLVVDNPGSSFRLNNLIGRVGRLNVGNPAFGDVFLFDKKACEYYSIKDNWNELTILAEDVNAISNDEILFLNKKFKNAESIKAYKDKVDKILEVSSRSVDELKKYNIKVDVAYKFAYDDYKNKFLQVDNINACIKLSCDLINRIAYKFKRSEFEEINYPLSTLPYLVFISMMINGANYFKIICWFEKKYGELSINNKNKLLEKLFELKKYIKFKLSKIIDYFNLFKIDYNANNILRSFVSKIKTTDEQSISVKIFDDLGVEESDFKKLNNLLTNKNDLSTSDVIRFLKNNKNEINKLELSPFTKRNIMGL